MLRPRRRSPALTLASLFIVTTVLSAAPRAAPNAAPTPPAVTATALGRTFFSEPLLALAFVSDTRLLALSANALMLLRTDSSDLATLAHLALETPAQRVRAPAGLLVVPSEADAVWMLTNRGTRAWLIAWSDDRLTVRADAEAVPVPGSTAALRYREGTNCIEGPLPRLGTGPFLAVELTEKPWAVTTAARLVWPNAPSAKGEDGPPRVGPTLAALWPGWLATSTNRTPGSGDALLVFARRKATVRQVASLPMDESIRALASRRSAAHVRLALATETSSGATRLMLVELRRNES
jgi:hypothetical protein